MRLSHASLALLLSAVVLAGPADDRIPKSPAARAALARLAAARQDAEEQFDEAIKKATAKAVADLDAAKAAAMKAGNLEEANRIQGAANETKSDNGKIGEELKSRLAGTTWQWAGTNTIRFDSDGMVSNKDWAARGLVTRWEPVDQRTVVLVIQQGRTHNLYAILSFDANIGSYRGLDFEGGKKLWVSKLVSR